MDFKRCANEIRRGPLLTFNFAESRLALEDALQTLRIHD